MHSLACGEQAKEFRQENAMKDFIAVDPFNSMQSMLQPSPTIRNAATQRLVGFWSNQDKMLDSMEQYARKWFERRHMGTQSALTVSRRISQAETPIDFMRACQAWAMGSFERMLDDALACSQDVVAMGQLLVSSAPSAEASNVDTSHAKSRQENRSKAA